MKALRCACWVIVAVFIIRDTGVAQGVLSPADIEQAIDWAKSDQLPYGFPLRSIYQHGEEVGRVFTPRLRAALAAKMALDSNPEHAAELVRRSVTDGLVYVGMWGWSPTPPELEKLDSPARMIILPKRSLIGPAPNAIAPVWVTTKSSALPPPPASMRPFAAVAAFRRESLRPDYELVLYWGRWSADDRRWQSTAIRAAIDIAELARWQ